MRLGGNNRISVCEQTFYAAGDRFVSGRQGVLDRFAIPEILGQRRHPNVVPPRFFPIGLEHDGEVMLRHNRFPRSSAVNSSTVNPASAMMPSILPTGSVGCHAQAPLSDVNQASS